MAENQLKHQRHSNNKKGEKTQNQKYSITSTTMTTTGQENKKRSD